MYMCVYIYICVPLNPTPYIHGPSGCCLNAKAEASAPQPSEVKPTKPPNPSMAKTKSQMRFRVP